MRSKLNPDSLDAMLVHVCRLHYERARALLEALGLYRGQPPLLHVVHDQEGQTHSELAARLAIQPSTMTKMIKRMEKAGFVERRSDPQDERLSRVYLTEAGRDILGRVEAVLRQIEAETYVGFSDEERSQLRAFLERISDNLQQAAAVEVKET